jgi:hypothetical protein
LTEGPVGANPAGILVNFQQKIGEATAKMRFMKIAGLIDLQEKREREMPNFAYRH